MPRGLPAPAWAALLLCLLGSAPVVLGADAPLDTLRDARSGPTVVTDTYTAAGFDISRRRLPEVTASSVPRAAAPSRPPRQDDPLGGAWRFHRARRAAKVGDSEGLRTNLAAAIAASPNHPEYRMWHTLLAARSFNADIVFKALPRSVLGFFASPTARARTVVMGHQAGLLLVTCFWTVLVVTLFAAWWRQLAHDLSARIFRDRSHRLRVVLPVILPLILLALKPGLFGFLAAMSLPLLVVTRGRTRGLLAATWLAAVLLVFPAWPALRLAVPALDPDSEVTLLERACELPPSTARIADLRERIGRTEDEERRARLLTALAIQEARRGRYTESNRLFARVLKHDPASFPAMVGSANNVYYLGRLEEAIKRYQAAAHEHPNRGEVHHNLAQVYFKKLFVPEATEALELSRRLGFVTPTAERTPGRNDFAAVVYPGLTNRDLAAACRDEATLYPALLTISSWRHVLGVPPVPLVALAGVPLLLALAVVGLSRRQNDPRECENCGVPLCRTCCKVRTGNWLCAACGETADRARSDMILATLLKNRSRDEGLARTSRVVRAGRLLPGAGHLICGRTGAAWIRITLLATGLFLLLSGWVFDPASDWSTPGLILDAEAVDARWLPLPAAGWRGWSNLPLLAGLTLVALALMIAQLDGPGLRRSLHDRHTMAPATGRGRTADAEAL